jgi:hypothetical protein
LIENPPVPTPEPPAVAPIGHAKEAFTISSTYRGEKWHTPATILNFHRRLLPKGAKGGAVSLQLRLAGGEGGIRTLGTGVSPYNGLAIQASSEAFAKFSTLLLFSMGYKAVDLIRSAWKRFVLIVQPLQFHDSLEDGAKRVRATST